MAHIKQGSRIGAVVGMLTSHQFGSSLIPARFDSGVLWVEFVIGSLLALSVFVHSDTPPI